MHSRRVRVLLIDDDEDDYIITRDLLDDLQVSKNNGRFQNDFGFDLDWVDNYEEGLTAIKSCLHEVYLVDYRLGEMDGLSLIRQGITLCQAPFILLTGQGDREIDVEAMRVGAADYLVKGTIDAALLERSIRYAVERKNADRIRQGLEEQLRQAQKMEAIGRLAGGIAHDFNNSLTIIMTCSQLIQRDSDSSPKLIDYAHEIERAGNQAHALTNQLMAISRNQEMKPRPFNLDDLIADVKKILRRAIGKNIQLQTTSRQPNSIIKADYLQLERVVMNLVLNARDAMPDGGKIILETDQKYLDSTHTSQYVGLKPGLYASLTVSDTGAGIPADVLPHIFEPFFTTKAQKGTGLGLATVYGIVQQSGGQIRVYSEIGFGTVFKIYLPLVAEASTLLAKGGSVETAVSTPDSTILIVDNDTKVRQLLVNLLGEQGYTILDAGDGADAWRLLQTHKNPIDLLITDVVMPGKTGRELAQLLHKKSPQTQIIFMSGYPRSILSYHGLLDEDSKFLDKPLEIKHLSQMVQQCLATIK